MLRAIAARNTQGGWRGMAVSSALACTPMASSSDVYASGGAAAEQGAGAAVSAGGSQPGRPTSDGRSPSDLKPGVTPPPVNAAGDGATLGADAPEQDGGNGPPPPPLDAGPPEGPPPRVCTGSALRLDGATFARFANPLQDDLTLEAWIKTAASLNGTQHFQGRGVIDADVIGGPNQNDFSATVLNGRFAFGTGNPDITIQGSAAVSDDEWVHVAATRRGSTGEMQIFVNAELEASGTSPNRNALTDPDTIAIGGGSLVRNFVGLIDEVRLWNVVRSAAELRASLHEITSADEPGLVAYYRFEDAGSTATEDSSSSGMDAVLEGAPSYEPSTALCPSPAPSP
jgi:hypothetical protein